MHHIGSPRMEREGGLKDVDVRGARRGAREGIGGGGTPRGAVLPLWPLGHWDKLSNSVAMSIRDH